MPITPEQIEAAQAAQHEAGRDPAPQVRLVAGPGTGKSSTIEERVRWLIANGAEPESIVAVSFTRASAFDLRGRVHGYCLANGQPDGADVAVTTLHSLAMRTLRRANALGGYPADPLVLDDWELRNIFEAEIRTRGWNRQHPTERGHTPRSRSLLEHRDSRTANPDPSGPAHY
jgi:DNA helicase-2/ATP-dependent DNA helicase PcrA